MPDAGEVRAEFMRAPGLALEDRAVDDPSLRETSGTPPKDHLIRCAVRCHLASKPSVLGPIGSLAHLSMSGHRTLEVPTLAEATRLNQYPQSTLSDAVARLEAALEREKGRAVRHAGRTVRFAGGVFRLLWNWNLLVPITDGELDVVASEDGVRAPNTATGVPRTRCPSHRMQ